MNYYMPFVPQANTTGLLSKIFKNGINWSTILTNTQKTLNIINQTIPVIKQAKPPSLTVLYHKYQFSLEK